MGHLLFIYNNTKIYPPLKIKVTIAKTAYLKLVLTILVWRYHHLLSLSFANYAMLLTRQKYASNTLRINYRIRNILLDPILISHWAQILNIFNLLYLITQSVLMIFVNCTLKQLTVVYFVQGLGNGHYKCWSKYAFSHCLCKKLKKVKKARKLRQILEN